LIYLFLLFRLFSYTLPLDYLVVIKPSARWVLVVIAQAELWLNLGLAQVKLQRYKAAKNSFTRGLEVDPHNALLRRHLDALPGSPTSGKEQLRTVGTVQDDTVRAMRNADVQTRLQSHRAVVEEF
jgi:tetratricopeptide (TPR) repeat protein